MMNYDIAVSNLNNSYVFYRNLFQAKALEIDPNRMVLAGKGLKIELKESIGEIDQQTFQLSVPKESLKQSFDRVRRFMQNRTLGIDCQMLIDKFHLTDPDGHLWIVSSGDSKEIDPEKCYLP